MGTAPPKPSTSETVLPALALSTTATTSSGLYRTTQVAVFEPRMLNAPSASMTSRLFFTGW